LRRTNPDRNARTRPRPGGFSGPITDLLQISEKTLARIAKRDPTFPVAKISTGVHRFHRGWLLKWVEQRERGRRSTAEPK
jgi:hypothetical protein